MLAECGCDRLILWVQIDIRVRLTADIATARARMSAIDTHTPIVSVIVLVPRTVADSLTRKAIYGHIRSFIGWKGICFIVTRPNMVSGGEFNIDVFSAGMIIEIPRHLIITIRIGDRNTRDEGKHRCRNQS
jgi:hypothetical protein